MAKQSTGLWSNLGILYESYGGFRSLGTSSYFIISVVVSLLCWRAILSEAWVEIAKVVLPPLAGFSVAAYALFFAILDEKARDSLKSPAPELDGRSPLLVLASAISHAVIVQIAGLIFSIVYSQKPFPYLECLKIFECYFNIIFSFLGLVLTMYGTILVIASVLSIFRVLQIQTKI